MEEHEGRAIWPAARFLAEYLMECEIKGECRANLVFLELGCGRGCLPSHVLCARFPSARIYVQDGDEIDVELPQESQFIKSRWSSVSEWESLPSNLSLIVAADIFYSSAKAEEAVECLAFLMRKYRCRSIIAHHLREPKATIWHLLVLHDLQAHIILRRDPLLLFELTCASIN